MSEQIYAKKSVMRLTPWAGPRHNYTCVPRVQLVNIIMIILQSLFGRGCVSYRKLIQEVLTPFATRRRYQENYFKKFVKSFASTSLEACI